MGYQVIGQEASDSGQYPVVVSTWPFVEAVRSAWRAVDNGLSAVDAVVEGCSACEELRCDGTAGFLSPSPQPTSPSSIHCLNHHLNIDHETFQVLDQTVPSTLEKVI
ncbi:probable isoaspartyl peptidase/L-asparaginase 3 [Malus sylvestris]|uniref:probable isoaspartyl peptidase/L-asparaginase 3 n=1 Tax=Malus sylvestris TaxID=3752 RepID=UPI0021AC5AA2|nr:probable isoaspartyl peptidase/L-asparaginase 3 [Malus sylvestris]XP_050156778.1 probable isoaspartyl peptidase/L-asparaginase 3 [Malus sylvestris]